MGILAWLEWIRSTNMLSSAFLGTGRFGAGKSILNLSLYIDLTCISTVIYICVTTTGYSTAFFIPTILNEFGYSPSSSQLHTIPVYAVGTFLTLFCAWWSDRIQHRYAFTIGGVILATIGYIILLCQGPLKEVDRMPIGVRYLAIFFITSGNYITQPLAVVWLANNMGGHYKRSFGAALQIGIGNVGGIRLGHDS